MVSVSRRAGPPHVGQTVSHELGNGGQGRLAGAGGLVVLHVGKQDRELRFRDRHFTAFRAMDDGDRRPPVALTGNQPVAKPVVDRRAANALFFQPAADRLLEFGRGQAVPCAGIDGDSLRRFRGLQIVGGTVAADHLHDGQVEFPGEFKIPVVVARHAHDGAGAVAHQHVIGDPDRDFFSVDRIDGVSAGENAGLGARDIQAVDLRLALRLADVGLHFAAPLRGGDARHQRVFRGQHDEGGAEQGVRPGGEDTDALFAAGHGEIDLGPLAAADPVALHLLHPLGPVELFQVGQQAVGVSRYAEEPLRHRLLLDRRIAAPAAAVLDLLVGQAGFAGGAPVDGRGGPIGQPLAMEQQEDPLGPLVVIGQAGIDFALPVIGAAGFDQGFAVGGGVFGHHLARIAAAPDGLVLGRLAEGVPAHGMQHVVALHALEAAECVGGHIVLEMADVEAGAGRIGKHFQAVVFFLLFIENSPEGVLFLPDAAATWPRFP